MEKLKDFLFCSFVLLSVSNGLNISDDGTQTEIPEPVGTGTGPASSLEKAQQTINSLLLPGPAIFKKVDENQFPDLDKGADQSIQATENAAEGTVLSAPSNMVPVPGHEASAPNNVTLAKDGMVSAPDKIASIPSNADSGSVALAASNDQQSTTADAPLESNTGMSLKDGVESEKMEPEGHQNDNHVSLEETGMLDMTENKWNNGDIEQSKEKIKSGEKTTQDDINEEKVLDDNTEESSKIDDTNFEDDDDWWTEDNYNDNDAEWLEEGEDKSNGDDEWFKEEQNDDDDDDDDDDYNWWAEEDDDDVDYDDADWFDDYTLAGNDNGFDDSEDVEDWPKDADGDYDNYDDSNSKEILDKISETTTEQAWLSTTTDDYDYSSEEDDYSSEEDYGSEENEFKDDEEESIQAGKELIESAHSFDNSYGAFAGTKVSSKASLRDGSFYTWTLLLTICLVLVGLFIFWNRHRVEKYIVSLRHPKPNEKSVGRRRDEEENLLENEYA